MAKKAVRDIDLKDKKVLIRAGFNVPLKDDVVTDDTHIKAALPAINYVLEQGGKAILSSHFGRVKTEEGKEGKLLAPVAKRLGGLLGKEVTFILETREEQLEEVIHNMNDGDIVMFENIRFKDIDDEKESKDDTGPDKRWASLDDILVNDIFGTAHRVHASNVGTAPAGIPTVAGFLTEKGIGSVSEAVEESKRPMVAIFGGTKVSSKIDIVENLIPKADKILIGGGMTYTFYGARGIRIDNSLVEVSKVELTKELIERAGDKLVLPVDSVHAPELSNDVETQIIEGDIPSGLMVLDTGLVSVKLSADILQGAKTVAWNRPVGVFEMSNFAKGTVGACGAIANLEGTTTVIGSGDSAAAVGQLGFADKFTHVSTDDGASLELLESRELPGPAATNDK